MSESWLDTLPEEIRAEPSLKTVPDVPTLAKNYVNAQKMIGSRIPAPEAGWEQKQWDEFYAKVGRPESPDKYSMPEVKLEEGVKIDEEKFKQIRAKVHGLGLTDRQFKGIMEVYLGSVNEQVKGSTSQAQAKRDAAMGELRQTWGDHFQENVNLAKNVLQKFGADESFMQYLEESNMGNNTQFIKFLHTIGTKMMEDTSRGGEAGAGLQIGDKTRALQEIDRLKLDKEFMEAFNSPQHIGHSDAVKRWMNLFSIAYPGKSD